MPTQAIDLSAGLVPAPAQSGGIDLSAGLIPTQFPPPPGTPSVPRPQVNMQPESLPEALGGNEMETAANAAGEYGSQVLNRVHDNLQNTADQIGALGTGGLADAMDVHKPHSIAALKQNLSAQVPSYGFSRESLVNVPADVLTGALLDSEGKAPAAANEAMTDAATAVQKGADARLTRSVRAALPAETAALPDSAVRGAEQIFQAAAPTGTNTRFRANVLSAAGDLAEVGRDVNTRLRQAKGGIVQPDMRARVTVDAINQHLQEMYRAERAPQIANHPDAPVSIHLSDDTAAGLTQMARSGEASLGKLAVKARGGQLTLAEADQLARGVNAELLKYEHMTPEAQAAARVNTRALKGLKVLDRQLSESIDDQLRIDGQPGVREYERRYAALSAIRDQIRARMNTAELQHPGVVKTAARAARNTISGMSGNIAGASQAAVADVRMGRALQQGLQQLADSGIKANRAVPRTPAPLELTPPPGRVPPATQGQLNFNGADREPGPKAPAPERRGGNGGGGPRATVLSEAEREQIRAKLDELHRGLHPNPHLAENPFDRHPSHNETIRAADILSGRR